MTTPDDDYWNELGVAWSAINPDLTIVAPRLKARLHRQSLLIMAGLVTGSSLSLVGLFLGVFTIWRGWTTGTWNFVTRGIAIGAISVLLAIAVSWLMPVRASDAARTVSDMIDLAIARAQRTLVAIRLGFGACIVAAVFGLVGSAIRSSLATPPRLSPVLDLAVLTMLALGLVLYGRHTGTNLERFRALKRALGTDPGHK